jgi:membrane protease YdiL (CAAX protease family)
LAPWLILLLYPTVIFLIVQPRAFRLARARKPGVTGMVALRASLEKELDESGRWLLIGKLLLAAVLLLAWMKWYGFTPEQLGIFSLSVRASFAMGSVAGALLVCGRMVFQGLVHLLPGVPPSHPKHPQSKGPVPIWFLTFIVAAAFEEPWRAFCLLAFVEAGWSQITAVTVTSIAFVHAQRSGFPPRIPGPNFEEVWEFIVGVFLAVLFLRLGTVVVPFVASLAYNMANLAVIRRATASSMEVPNP